MQDSEGYLKRMSLPMQDKLRVLSFLQGASEGKLLDVGCADGSVTESIAKILPDWQITGIDLNQEFIDKANSNHSQDNLNYEKIYLRDLLAREQRYNAISFLSVLHEFYSYGEGKSSVVKALSDAHELLSANGRILVRDMILSRKLKESDWKLGVIIEKISKSPHANSLEEFEEHWGKVENLYDLNHFLLKYLYKSNWDRELPENYVGMSLEDYMSLFDLLDMKVLFHKNYLIDFLKNKWIEDFGLTEEEAWPFSSTTILAVEK